MSYQKAKTGQLSVKSWEEIKRTKDWKMSIRFANEQVIKNLDERAFGRTGRAEARGEKKQEEMETWKNVGH